MLSIASESAGLSSLARAKRNKCPVKAVAQRRFSFTSDSLKSTIPPKGYFFRNVPLASTFRPIYNFLLNKWYFDEFYDAVIVRPLVGLARGLWKVGDSAVIDGIPPSAHQLKKALMAWL